MPYLDENGNEVQAPGDYLDAQGNPTHSLIPRDAKIEPTPGLLSRLGTQAKGFFQELPLIASRGVGLLQDVAQGQTPWDPTVAAERLAREKKINEWLGAAENSGLPEQRTGRILARMVPGTAAALLTGGQSLPIQAAVQGGVQGLQSLSEGASPTEAATGAGIAALGPFAMGGTNAVVSKAKAPFAASVDQTAADAAGRLGVDLPASAMTTSSRAQGLERMASRLFGGQGIEQRGINAAQDIGEQAGNMSTGANPTLAGDLTAADYTARRATLQGAKNAAYAKVGDLTGIAANPAETIALVDSLLAQGTLDPETLANLRKLREAISPVVPDQQAAQQGVAEAYQKAVLDAGGRIGGPAPPGVPSFKEFAANYAGGAEPTPRSVADLMSQQSGIDYGGPNALRDAALSNRLRDALRNDITSTLEAASPEQRAQLATANAKYMDYADLSRSNLGKTVSTNMPFGARGTPDQITKAVLRSGGSRSDLERLMEVATPETQVQLQRVLLNQAVGDGKNLTPKAIQTFLKNNPNADVVLTADQLSRLRDLSTVSKALARTNVGSSTAPNLTSLRYLRVPGQILAAGAAGGLAGVQGMIAAMGAAGIELGTEGAVAKFIGSPAGQRWLTTGFSPAKLPGQMARTPFTIGARIPSELSMEDRRRRAELDALLAQQQQQ